MRILEQVQWLNNNGHKAWIAASPRSKTMEHAVAMNLPNLVVDFRGSANPLDFRKIWLFCKQQRISIVDAHDSRDATLCAWLRLLGYPVVRSLHVTKKIRFDFTHALFWRYGSDRIIVTAELLKKRLHELGLDPIRIDVVGEGIDLVRFDWRISGRRVREEFGLTDDCKVVANIGMIRPDKGQLQFVQMAALVHGAMPDVRFLLVGEGTKPEYEQDVRDLIREFSLEQVVILTGYRKDVPEIMAAADCIVLASVDVEAQSRVVPQAFAMRKPVVATDVGAVAELVEPRTGWLVPGQDIPAMARAVQEVLRRGDPARVEAAHELALNTLSFERMMELTLDSYRLALGRSDNEGERR